MHKRLVLNAAKAVSRAYNSPTHNVKSTEWRSEIIYHKNNPLHCIAIAGTNDVVDWVWNLAMASWDGVKLASYFSAKRILKSYIRRQGIPLLVCGHSKAGPTAMYLAKLLNADYCVAFNPAPGFRKQEKLENTLIVIDPDDIVHHLGKINFNHPDCEVYEMPNDKKGFSIADHSISNAINHFKGLV